MIDNKVLDSFCGKRVLITGGTGLIGREISNIMVEAGAEVTSVSLDQIEINKGVNQVIGDPTDYNFCKDIIAGNDFVFHVAGIKGSIDVTVKNPASFLCHLMFNTNVLEASRINNVKKPVYTSSIGAYSSSQIFKEGQNEEKEPMDMYPGWAKRMAELQIKAYSEQYGMSNYAIETMQCLWSWR